MTTEAGQEKAGWPVMVLRRLTPEADAENYEAFHNDFPPGAVDARDDLRRYLPESTIAGLVEALRYIAGEDVAGMEPHMPPKEVAAAALSSYKQEVE